MTTNASTPVLTGEARRGSLYLRCGERHLTVVTGTLHAEVQRREGAQTKYRRGAVPINIDTDLAWLLGKE